MTFSASLKRWVVQAGQALVRAGRWLLQPANSAIVLALITAAALALRLVGLDWDKGNGILCWLPVSSAGLIGPAAPDRM
jgi:hypothetical protein